VPVQSTQVPAQRSNVPTRPFEIQNDGDTSVKWASAGHEEAAEGK